MTPFEAIAAYAGIALAANLTYLSYHPTKVAKFKREFFGQLEPISSIVEDQRISTYIERRRNIHLIWDLIRNHIDDDKDEITNTKLSSKLFFLVLKRNIDIQLPIFLSILCGIIIACSMYARIFNENFKDESLTYIVYLAITISFFTPLVLFLFEIRASKLAVIDAIGWRRWYFEIFVTTRLYAPDSVLNTIYLNGGSKEDAENLAIALEKFVEYQGYRLSDTKIFERKSWFLRTKAMLSNMLSSKEHIRERAKIVEDAIFQRSNEKVSKEINDMVETLLSRMNDVEGDVVVDSGLFLIVKIKNDDQNDIFVKRLGSKERQLIDSDPSILQDPKNIMNKFKLLTKVHADNLLEGESSEP